MATSKSPFDIKTGNVTGYQPAKAAATGYTPSGMTATGYDATSRKAVDWKVDSPQTVQGQVEGIIAKNSPLMQQAAAKANIDANARGLLNSSMAVGAGQGAVMDRALQIAQPDAATFANSAQFNAAAGNAAAADNQAAINRASEFGATAKNAAAAANQAATNQSREFGASATNQASLSDQAAANRASEFGANAKNTEALAVLDGRTKDHLARIEAEFKTQMQGSQSAAAMYSDTIKSIGEIMRDKDLDGGAKQNLINQQIAMLQNSMQLQSAIANIPGLDALIGNLGKGAASVANPTAAPVAPIPSGAKAPGAAPAPMLPPAGSGLLDQGYLP